MPTKREEARTLLDTELPVGREVHSLTQSDRFFQLTNTLHSALVTNWKTGGIMTACNGFTGWYAARMGITGIKSFFQLENSLAAINQSDAWVPADGKSLPQYGDILHHRQGGTGLHVDVCIGFASGQRLMRAAAGQTLFKSPRKPDQETDVIKRVTGAAAYNYRNLIGWLDLDAYFSAAWVPEAHNWAMGWWDVNDGTQYYYHFANDGHVQYVKSRPTTPFGPPRTAVGSGKYSIRSDGSLVATWSPWDGAATVETFTRVGGSREMTGESSRRGNKLVARRI